MPLMSNGDHPAPPMPTWSPSANFTGRKMKLDFPFLLSQCARSAPYGVSAMAGWRYVDTLEVLRATDGALAGDCMKLQCAFARACGGSGSLRAHRALDDCVALERVIRHVCERLGVAPLRLLRLFSVALDEGAALAELSALAMA